MNNLRTILRDLDSAAREQRAYADPAEVAAMLHAIAADFNEYADHGLAENGTACPRSDPNAHHPNAKKRSCTCGLDEARERWRLEL